MSLIPLPNLEVKLLVFSFLEDKSVAEVNAPKASYLHIGGGRILTHQFGSRACSSSPSSCLKKMCCLELQWTNSISKATVKMETQCLGWWSREVKEIGSLMISWTCLPVWEGLSLDSVLYDTVAWTLCYIKQIEC